LGLIMILFFVTVGLLAPWLAPIDPLEMDQTSRLRPPNARHWMGTDEHGRDILSRLMYGARISTSVGLIAVVISGTCGVALGLAAGFWPRIDAVVMRLVDLWMAFPFLLLAIGIVSILGPGLRNTMIAVGLSGIPGYCRVTRSSVLSIREKEFVESARAVGASDATLLLRHVLPNVLAPIIVLSSLTLGSSILGSAALSFLGLGAQPPTPEWGFMLNNARSYIHTAWWYSLFPGLMIMLMVLGFNLFGDGLRDALDPRLKRE